MTNLPTKYPHLLPEDAELWNDYQELYTPKHHTFLYDVGIGPGRDPGPDFPDNIRTMALSLSKRRIDVIGISGDSVDIYELTQNAGLKAAGQALVYPHWLTVTWQLNLPVTTTIICRSYQPDIVPVLSSIGVQLVVVPFTKQP